MEERIHYYPRCRAVLHLILDGFGEPDDDSEEIRLPILVRSATIHVNSYKQADSYDITFDELDLPIDPDLIRAGAADIYLYQSRGAEDDDFVVSRQYALTEDTTGFLPRDPSAALAVEAEFEGAIRRWTQGNPPIIAGTFDDVNVERGPSGNTISIRGQDYTAYLAGRQWPPTPKRRARRIPVGRRLDDTMREIIAEADPRGKLKLEVRGIPAGEIPFVKPTTNAHRRGIPVDSKTTYWDVLYKLALRHGYITFVEGTSVVLAAPKNITKANVGSVRDCRWGANLESLSFKRRMGKEVVPTIIMQGVDDDGNVVEVEYPPKTRRIDSITVKRRAADVRSIRHTTKIKAKPKTAASAAPKAKRSTTVHQKDEFLIIPAGNIGDRATLERMAEVRFNLVGRGERVLTLRTKVLRDLADLPLVPLRAGDAIKLTIEDYAGKLLADRSIPADAKVGHLIERGYAPRIARLLVERIAQLEALRRPVRVREATFTYGTGDDEGIQIEVEACDFLMVNDARANAEAMAAELDGKRDALRQLGGKRIGLGSSAAAERAVTRPRRTR